MSIRRDGIESPGFYAELAAQLGSQPVGAEHPEGIFSKPFAWVTNAPNDPVLEVVKAPHVVDYAPVAFRGESIYGEVSPDEVFLKRR